MQTGMAHLHDRFSACVRTLSRSNKQNTRTRSVACKTTNPCPDMPELEIRKKERKKREMIAMRDAYFYDEEIGFHIACCQNGIWRVAKVTPRTYRGPEDTVHFHPSWATISAHPLKPSTCRLNEDLRYKLETDVHLYTV